MTTYDVHAHCVPEGLFTALRREPERYGTEVVEGEGGGGGTSVRFANGLTTRPVRDDLVDVDRRLASMDAARVDVQLVSSWVDVTGYGLPVDAAVRYTRMFNEVLGAMIADHPGRFLGLCNVPLQDPDAAATELRRAVVGDGFVGAEIMTTVEDVDLGDPSLDPFWGMAAELRCPILIHPSFTPLAGQDLSRHMLDNLVGRPTESTIAAARMIFAGVLERFAELRLILVHGGGFVPWQVARWDRGYEAIPRATAGNLSRRPSASLRNVWFDTVLHDARTVGYLIDWAGADRVVLGSDYPFPMGDLTPVDTLDAVTALDDATRQAILQDNVERLLADIRR
ncbi:MAG TPA: amidohydrolase family protein [Euzebyales bacterium]|nr:amidohydrolase family protein [Euzebyales bacterium]